MASARSRLLSSACPRQRNRNPHLHTDTLRELADLLFACEKEPIHISGAIRPFGVLLNVDEPLLHICNISVNTKEALRIDAADLIRRSFAEFVVADQLHELRNFLAGDNLREQTPMNLTLHLPGARYGGKWQLSARRHAGLLILKIEPGGDDDADLMSFHRKVRDAVQALQAAPSLQQLCEAAVDQVRSITGFDRVMLYRLNDDWHGNVIGESCAPEMYSYLNHHFPASDIPPQARAVFLQNRS